MREGSRVLTVAFGVLLLSEIPLLFIFIGLGWTWRGMAALPHVLSFIPKDSISP